jgi:dTDP-4-dehydrorhamnose 3,5-epimerase
VNVIATAIPGVLVLEPHVFRDDRGFFVETFNRKVFEQAVGRSFEFVQDNHSRSTRGVLRGLHLQLPPHEQGKLVRCTRGRIFDVAVDVRGGSPNRGCWIGEELSEDNHRQLWLPPGMAHGFVVVSDVAEMQYKVTDYYAPQAERSIRWDDPTIGVKWSVQGVEPIVSARDRDGMTLAAVLAELDTL